MCCYCNLDHIFWIGNGIIARHMHTLGLTDWFYAFIFSHCQVLESFDSNIFFLLMCASLSTGCVFFFCSVGSYTTDNFLRFADISYESLWYKLPVHLQKYLPLIIADAQRPRFFRGLGIVNLNLMAFTKVVCCQIHIALEQKMGFHEFRVEFYDISCSIFDRLWRPWSAIIWRSKV